LDIPGFEGEFMWYEEWRKRTLDRADFDPSLLMLAMDGQRPVGVVKLLALQEMQSLYNNYTGVDREYRGRGIASALKQLSIILARQRKYSYIRTNNDSMNIPMLKINQRLGYIPVPGNYQMTRG
jgi:GNAT superfamily N-acetyltransferase